MQCSREGIRCWLAGAALAAIALVLSGCGAPRRVLVDGLPDDQYLVGGGSMIDWRAPTAGTAYLVEKTTGKIIETRSMEAGDSFGFSVGSGQQRIEFEKRLGIEFADMNLWLYFVPAGEVATHSPVAR